MSDKAGDPEWARSIGAGISKFIHSVLPMLNDGFVGAAGMEAGTANWIIKVGIRTMPLCGFQPKSYGFVRGPQLV